MELLEVEGLRTYFYTEAGVVKALDGVDLTVREGETLGLVGESGSGKTVTALSILRIVPHPGKIVGGRVLYRGENLFEKSEKEMQKLRGALLSGPKYIPKPSLHRGEPAH